MKGASYREALPAPSLRRFIECYWFLQAPEDAQSNAEPILPDGCMELVLNLGAPFQRCHEDGRVEPQPSRMLVGQMDHAVTVRAGGPVDVVGVRFHPSGAHPLFRFSMGSLANRLVPLAEAVDLPDFLAGKTRIQERKRALDANLVPRFERSMQSDTGFERAIASVVEAEGRIGVDGLAQDMGIGPRQLERMFRERVGIGPKRFARILRFQSVFRRSRLLALRWAELALDCGYYDQAHFIRDFRSFTGTSPGALFASPDNALTRVFTRRGRSRSYNTLA